MKPKKEIMDRKESLVAVLLASAFFIVLLFQGVTAEYNYDHVNVTTQVNVTNAGPEIQSIVISPSPNMVLAAGSTKTVYCNTTIRDWNGFADIDTVNATFYHYYNLSTQIDDNNEHYTNTSCAEISNDGQYIANYSCSMEIQYFANNGSWSCNVSVNDTFNFNDALNDTVNVGQLMALNVTDTIDYGSLNVTDYSQNITAVITNFGNADINISVLGYGRVEGDGWGLVCSQGSNITIDNERYYNALVGWSEKITLTGVNADINVTLNQQVDDAIPVTQNTIWQLYVPPNPFGICNGTVRFTATTPN